MKLDKNHPLHSKVVLKDVMGKHITMVKSWDTDTETAEIFVLARQDSNSTKCVVVKDPTNPQGVRVAVATVALPGCKLHYKDTNLEVPKEDLNVASNLPPATPG